MRSLSPADHALITLFEIEGWSIAELAALEGKPVGTIKSRLSRARNKMRQMIAGYLSNEVQPEKEYALPQSES